MRKLFWFGVGVLLSLVAALATAEDIDPRKATAASIMGELDAQNEVAYAWVAGLTQGAFIAYINYLMANGMTTKLAIEIAEANCGDLTAEDAFFRVYAGKKTRDAPLAHTLPTFVFSYCDSKRQGA